jgi:DNA-binding SARP family transcriptional activator/predicted ATPase
MAQLTIRLLGAFQASLDDRPLQGIQSDKVRGLLAYLAAESEQAHRRDRLAGLFWPELPERRARANLSQALHNLRTVIGDHRADTPFLTITHETIQFNRASDYWMDVANFTALLSEADAHDHRSLESCEQCLEALQEAVSLYRGEFMAGFYLQGVQSFQEWCLVTRERLHRQLITALQRLAAAFEERGEIEQALECSHWQVEHDPYNEAAQQRLMRLLFSRGQSSAALAQYESYRRMMADELGVEPGLETTELYTRIRAAHAGSSPTQGARHNLPGALTTLVGRQEELQEIQGRLADPDCRVLTILGAGGSGKTRLALEVARAELEHFTHGVYFVPLNPVQSTHSIPPAIAEALDFPAQAAGDLQGQLLAYLGSKNFLLLLDGFEHLQGGAGLVAEFMRAAPGVKVLVTSRSRLNIKGEHIFPLGGLSYPVSGLSLSQAQQYGAVQLFLTSGQRLRPDYSPVESDFEAIIQICQTVQGLPLGILLASAWMGTLSLAEIAAEIEHSLDFLSAQWIDLPLRHRSLRATFEYSLNLQSRREREIFQSLCVFRGGFTRAAARQVSQASPYDLRAFVEKSLLQRIHPDRYEIHELLRQYGMENLEKSPEASWIAHEQHSAYYGSALERWGEALKSDRQEIALAEMDIEHENIRAAWDWTAEHGGLELVGKAVDGLCRYYDLRARYQEGQSACRFVSEKLRQQDVSVEGWRTWARLCIWESHFSNLLSKYEKAQKLIEESQALLERASAAGLDTRLEEALIDLELGNVFFSRDLEVAQGYYLRSLRVFEELNAPWYVMTAHALLGFCSTQRGHFDEAQAWCEKSLKLAQSHGDPRSAAATLRRLGLLHLRKGDLDLGLKVMEEAFKAFQSIGDQASHAAGLHCLGQAHLWFGRYSESIDLLSRSLRVYEDLGNPYEVAFINALLGLVMVQAGLYREAENLLDASRSMTRENGNRRLIGGLLLISGWLEMSAGDFIQAEEYLRESINHYRKLKHLDELGWVLATLGYTISLLGSPKRALELLCEALRVGLKSRAYATICHALPPSAVLLGQNGDPERSLELYTIACQSPMVAESVWFKDVYGRRIDGFTESLPEELVLTVRERASKRDLWETAAELLEEMECDYPVEAADPA